MTLDVFKFLTDVPGRVRTGKFDALKKQASCIRQPATCPEDVPPNRGAAP